MIAHSVIAAVQAPAIREIIVNSPPGYEERTDSVMKAYAGNVPYRIVAPGASRQESAYILAKHASYDRILVHEAARPFIDKAGFEGLLDNPEQNVGYFLPLPFSICRINEKTSYVVEGLLRETVFNVQLPQKFDREVFLRAHRLAEEEGRIFTEDAALVVAMTGVNVLSVAGSVNNIKVTSFEDFGMAEHLALRVVK